MISKDDAIRIATGDAGGFLGTWVDADLVDGVWQVRARSKSARPPALYRIDSASGRILFRCLNTDAGMVDDRAKDFPPGAATTFPSDRGA